MLVPIASFGTDVFGQFDIDFVLQNPLGAFKLKALDVETGETGGISAQVQFNAQKLNFNVILPGRGSIAGVTFIPLES